MSSHNTNTNADESNSNQAIEHAIDAACEKLGIDADEPLGEEGVRAILEELDDVLLTREDAVAAANGDLPPSEEEQLEAYDTGVMPSPGAERPFEPVEAPEPAHDIEDADEDLEAFGTGVSGDTSREDRERREEQAEVLADALERLEERRDGGHR